MSKLPHNGPRVTSPPPRRLRPRPRTRLAPTTPPPSRPAPSPACYHVFSRGTESHAYEGNDLDDVVRQEVASRADYLASQGEPLGEDLVIYWGDHVVAVIADGPDGQPIAHRFDQPDDDDDLDDTPRPARTATRVDQYGPQLKDFLELLADTFADCGGVEWPDGPSAADVDSACDMLAAAVACVAALEPLYDTTEGLARDAFERGIHVAAERWMEWSDRWVGRALQARGLGAYVRNGRLFAGACGTTSADLDTYPNGTGVYDLARVGGLDATERATTGPDA